MAGVIMDSSANAPLRCGVSGEGREDGGRPVDVNNARFTNNRLSRPAGCFTARSDVSLPLTNDRGRVCAMRVDPEIAFIYDAI